MPDDRSASEAERVGRWARAMCRATGDNPDVLMRGVSVWTRYERHARAAIALADAEATERPTWAEYERVRDLFEECAQNTGYADCGDDAEGEDFEIASRSQRAARTTLDALVRRMMAKGAPDA